MRRAARVDRNQKEIIEALRGIGATVQPLHMVGSGCPDILVGYRGKNYLFEIKDGELTESRVRLTTQEKDWHDRWRGNANIVYRAGDAIEIITASRF
jgi:hypothetical protein